MEIQVGVKNQSIESSGITSDYKDAICEYIWNGLEAHATEINILYNNNAAFGIDELTISDNGDGIDYNTLADTFGAFLASQKNQMSLQMKSKANKGKGRFSFIAFSSSAKWSTVYNDGGVFKKFDIALNNEKKEIVNYTEPAIIETRETGTVVSFSGISNLTVENMSFQVLEPILLREFAWFLDLSKSKNIKICVNNVPIDYSKYINTEFSEKTIATIDNIRNDAYGQMRKRDLENVTKELYKLEPHIFYKLKPIQEKSFLAF